MKSLCLLCLVISCAAQEPVVLPAYQVSSATGEVLVAPVIGDGSGVLDTPRAYSSLDRSALDDHAVVNIASLQAFDASVQTPGTYGYVATVAIRGDMAELYQNGQRRTNNAAGFQPSLRAANQIDIVKGAAPIVFGPGFYSGGYLNIQTKRATEAAHTYGLTLGTLSANHSYPSVTLFADDTYVISPSAAVRTVYEGRKDNTFYKAGRNDSQDLYVTLHKDLKGATLDIFLEQGWQAIPQIEGINRPTQDLIDTRIYAGIPLKPTDNLVSPGDFSNAAVSTVQAIYARGDFRSYTLAEYVNRRRFNAFAYLEWARQLTFDQRLEWHHDTGAVYTLYGANARYEYRQSYTNYFNAFFDAYDITRSGVRDATTQDGYMLGSPGPDGRLFFGPLDGNTDTTESKVFQFAPFFQQRLKWGDWQVLYGARVDGYRVFVTDPLTRSVSDDLTTYSTSYMGSIIRTFGANSLYVSYAHLSSVSGTVSGGGIVFAPDLKINSQNLRSVNRLYEAGFRHEGKTKVSLVAFWQERQQPDLYAYKPNDIVVRGIEGQISHAFGKVYASSTMTYNEGNFVNSLPFEFAPTIAVPGDYRIPGLSRIYATSTVGYRGKRWGGSISGRYQTEQSGNALGTYRIPAQYNLDAALSYRRKTWDVTLNVGNLTNTWQWVHNGDSFGDNAVIHHAPLRAATLTVRIY